ncbi:Uncharacterised protein [Klebsiella variicola]|nr:Uncharacterised protein [Klebsiella variicola]
MLRQYQFIVFERGLEARHVLAVVGDGGHHHLHLSAVLLRRLFGQIVTVPPAIELDTVAAGQPIADKEQRLLLLLIGNVGQLDQERYCAGGVVIDGHRRKNGQVARPREVLAEAVAKVLRQRVQHGQHLLIKPFLHIQRPDDFRHGIELSRTGEAQNGTGAPRSTFTDGAGQIGAAAVLRLTVVFFAGVFFGGGIAQQVRQPLRLGFR